MTSKIASRLKAGVAAAAILALAALAGPAWAFCGFYVAQADAKLFNKSSKVVLTRDGDKTSITMANDYQGEPKRIRAIRRPCRWPRCPGAAPTCSPSPAPPPCAMPA